MSHRICLILLLFTLLPEARTMAQKARPATALQKPTPVATSSDHPHLFGYNQVRNKFPFERKDSVVRFYLRGHQEAKRVVVTGPFTNWSTERQAMVKTDSGWIANVQLSPGRHPYKFVIDGSWEVDEDNLLFEVVENGYRNSIYYQPSVDFFLPGFGRAQNVSLSGSFNAWQTAVSMNKTKRGWEMPVYLASGPYVYSFVVDGKTYADPTSPVRLKDENGQWNSLLVVGKPHPSFDGLAPVNNVATVIPERKLPALYNRMGDRYLQLADYTSAAIFFRKAIVLYKAQGNNDSTGALHLKMETIARETGDFPAARENIQQAILAYERANNEKGLAEAFRTMGYHYTNLGKWSEAAGYYEKARVLYQRQKNTTMEARMLYQLGHSNLLIPNIAKAWAFVDSALSRSKAIGYQRGIAEAFSLMGVLYETKNDLLTAADYFKKSLVLSEEIGSTGGIAEMNMAFADLYQKAPDSVLEALHVAPSEKYALAIARIRRFYQLYREAKNIGRQHVAVRSLSDVFEKSGQYDSAYHYYKQWVAMQNTFYNTEKEKQLVRLETRFENMRKEDSLRLDKQLADQQLQQQLLLAHQQQQQLQLQQSQLSLANKEKDLQHLAYLKMQADLQNEQLEKQQKEKQLSLAEKEKQLQSAKVKALTQEQAIGSLNRQRQWLFTLGGFGLFAFASLFFINRSRLRSLRLQSQLDKEKAELEQKETLFQRQVADISLTALRSQMNPHFIFNCLNSIKLYTVQNNTAAASEYLTKFSKLIRLVLENSRSEKITLTSELKALQLYIEMEAMRFKQKLRYTLSINEDVETDYIEIPPLLLQPYVENAIWHGLMHKEEGGHIDIAVATIKEASVLEVRVTDDGIGRRKAAAIKQQSGFKHSSYGMKATADRIALINQIYKAGAGVTILDLADPEGQPAGTQVVIQIPI